MKKGFTLVELLGVIVIIGIVAAIIYPMVKNTLDEQKKKLYEEQVNNIEAVAYNWTTANTSLITANGDYYLLSLDTLKDEGYLKDQDIINPINKQKMDDVIAISWDSNSSQYIIIYGAKVPPDSCFETSENNGEVTINRYLCGNTIKSADYMTIEYLISENGEKLLYPYNITYNNDGTYTNIIIPSTIGGKKVVKIAQNAFSYREDFSDNLIITDKIGIESVVIPSGIKVIDDKAFSFNQIKKVVIPSSVLSINTSAFNGNQLPDSEAYIYKRTDTNNDGIAEVDTNTVSSYGGAEQTNVVIPNYIKSIGDYSFMGLGLKTVVIPDSVTDIGTYSFAGNILTELTIPSSVKTINSFAFCFNKITSVIIPNNVTYIGEAAFGANQLTDLILSDGIKTIESSAYAYNKLTNVVIPNSVTHIGNYAFSFNQLTSVTISNSIAIIPTYAFYENQLTSVTIPNSVTSIGHAAFSYNQLTSVVIPNSVTSIDEFAFNNNKLSDSEAYIYKRTDTNNDGVAEIDNTTLVSYGGAKRDNVIIPSNVKILGDSSFADNQLTSVTIPNSVTTIDLNSFADNQLTSVTIPNSVTSIGDYAFTSNQLTSVTIGTGVTTIGSYAFEKDSSSNPNLTNIYNKSTISNTSTVWNSAITGSTTGDISSVSITTP